MDVTLHVCVLCSVSRTAEERACVRGGRLLWEAVVAEAEKRAVTGIRVEPVDCMSNCLRPCTAALAGQGRFTYLFGDLGPASTASAVLDCAELYRDSAKGFMARADRPEPLRKGILARIPPIG